MDVLCKNCGEVLESSDKFCRKCGAKVDISSFGLTLRRKVTVYAFSIILAPLGFYWFFKYFRNNNPEVRKVGFMALYITLFMIVVLVIANVYFFNALESYIGKNMPSYYYGF